MNTKVTLAVESVNEMKRTVENVVRGKRDIQIKFCIIYTQLPRIIITFIPAINAAGGVRHEEQDEAVRGGNEEDTASDEPRRRTRESPANTLQTDDAN